VAGARADIFKSATDRAQELKSNSSILLNYEETKNEGQASRLAKGDNECSAQVHTTSASSIN
jgi:hypothetical protein